MKRSLKSGKVLVLGSDTKSFLSVIRSLGRAGLSVHAIASDPLGHSSTACQIATRSRYLRTVHRLAVFDPLSEQWGCWLAGLMRAECFDLVIPCTDEWALALRHHRALLNAEGRVYLHADAVFDSVRDKFAMNVLARARGIPVPRERVIMDEAEIGQVVAEFHLPVVLKPRSSFELDDLAKRREVRIASTWPEFAVCARECLRAGPVAVQQYVPGHGVGVEVLADEGKPLLVFQHRRLHEPPRGGAGTLRQGDMVQPHLLSAVTSLLSALGYTGVAMVEFRVNEKSGEWTFLEVNGRFWGSLPLAVASGADFPLALYEFLVEGQREFRQHPRQGLRCRNLMEDCWWLASMLRESTVPHALRARLVTQVAREAIGNVIAGRERSDTLVLDDPMPGFSELGAIISRITRGLATKVHHRWAQSWVARAYLCRRARCALAGARTVLFICKGNICRSPFAEQVARRLLGDCAEFGSAGYLHLPARPSPTNAVAAAASMGVDLSTHRSRALDEETMVHVDAAFVFDHEDLVKLGRSYPRMRSRIHFLGALDPTGPLYIPDPWEGDDARFRATYARIAEALSAVVRCGYAAAAEEQS